MKELSYRAKAMLVIIHQNGGEIDKEELRLKMSEMTDEQLQELAKLVVLRPKGGQTGLQ